MKKGKLVIQDIVLIGMMVAVIEACKYALLALPNIELTSFWLIIFTLFFGWKIVFVVPVFILVEGSMFGMSLWWIMYLYAWPILVGVTYIFRKVDSAWFFAIISSIFGFSFGFLCSFPYFFIGASSGGIGNGFHMMITWWIAGIPWDLVHGVGNFALMLVLYKPITIAMKKVRLY